MARRLYTALLWLLLPLALVRLFWRARRAPAYLVRWPERLALYETPPPRADIWVHAVSVGEVQAASPLIRHLLAQGLGVLVTTTTPTGAERLRALFADRVHHVWTPFDLPAVVGRLLERVQPRLVLVIETEIWPNLLATCERRGIPVILANARLSARSARSYARLGAFTRETMGRFTLIAAQGEQDAARFLALGVDPARLRVTGSIKFDVQLPASLLDGAEAIRRDWGTNRPVWIAASTHEGEEEAVLDAHRQVRTALPGALLVLVPRHPERFDRVAGLVERAGFPLQRRSDGRACDPDCAVYLGDSMGELPMFQAAADVAFVGGSLVPTGGHNPLEAAACGVPVLVGPHAFNFADIIRRLCEQQGAVQVTDADTLARVLVAWLGDAALRTRVGENARTFVAANRGALARLIELVRERLGTA